MAIQSGKEASASSERLWREQFAQLVSKEELQTLSEQSLPDTFAAIGGLWVEVADPPGCRQPHSSVGPGLVGSGGNPLGPLDGTEDECLWRDSSRGLTWAAGQITHPE